MIFELKMVDNLKSFALLGLNCFFWSLVCEKKLLQFHEGTFHFFELNFEIILILGNVFS